MEKICVEEAGIMSYADDDAPFVCSENFGVTLKKPEGVGKILFGWFANNFLKANAENYNLFLSMHEPLSVNIR